MKTFIQIFLVVASLSATAQYQKIGVEGRLWNMYMSRHMLFDLMLYTQIGQDTVINGKSLPTLQEVSYGGNQKIRTLMAIDEDTVRPAITFYFPTSNQAGHQNYGDSLYLDLGLSPGDSAAYTCQAGFSPDSTFYYVLDSTSTFTDQQGISRQVWHFHVNFNNFSGSHTFPFTWTEGLGNLTYGGIYLPLPPVCQHVHYPGYDPVCISDSSEQVLLYQNTSYSSCQPLGEEELNLPGLEVFPVPARDVLQLNIPPRYFSGPMQLKITGQYGRLLKTKEMTAPENTLDISFLAPGVYLLRVSGQQDGILTKKIMVQ